MCGFRATRFAIEIERVRPRNDRAFVAERVQFRERLKEQLAPDPAPAHRLHDAGRAEHAEAAIVRFVCGEAGERAVFFRSDDAERAGAFEAPDLSEVLFDEFEDSGAAAASAAEVSRDPGARSGRRSTVYVPCPRFFDEPALRKKCARSFILREHSRHE